MNKTLSHKRLIPLSKYGLLLIYSMISIMQANDKNNDNVLGEIKRLDYNTYAVYKDYINPFYSSSLYPSETLKKKLYIVLFSDESSTKPILIYIKDLIHSGLLYKTDFVYNFDKHEYYSNNCAITRGPNYIIDNLRLLTEINLKYNLMEALIYIQDIIIPSACLTDIYILLLFNILTSIIQTNNTKVLYTIETALNMSFEKYVNTFKTLIHNLNPKVYGFNIVESFECIYLTTNLPGINLIFHYDNPITYKISHNNILSIIMCLIIEIERLIKTSFTHYSSPCFYYDIYSHLNTLKSKITVDENSRIGYFCLYKDMAKSWAHIILDCYNIPILHQTTNAKGKCLSVDFQSSIEVDNWILLIDSLRNLNNKASELIGRYRTITFRNVDKTHAAPAMIDNIALNMILLVFSSLNYIHLELKGIEIGIIPEYKYQMKENFNFNISVCYHADVFPALLNIIYTNQGASGLYYLDSYYVEYNRDFNGRNINNIARLSYSSSCDFVFSEEIENTFKLDQGVNYLTGLECEIDHKSDISMIMDSIYTHLIQAYVTKSIKKSKKDHVICAKIQIFDKWENPKKQPEYLSYLCDIYNKHNHAVSMVIQSIHCDNQEQYKKIVASVYAFTPPKEERPPSPITFFGIFESMILGYNNEYTTESP
ncbi:hypothetical protein NEOKW01_0460 [Nematocida sp. AWRm80]|nr:hypothetical protein NEOKW01_0460 [Nematocida sp. AWRm80]